VRILELLSSARWTGPAEPMASVARELRARGHAVEIAVETHRAGDLAARLRSDGHAVREDLALSSKAGPIRYLLDVRRLAALAREGLDVLHANFSHDHGLALLAARGRGQVRVVRTVHAARALARGGVQAVAFRHTDGLVTVCEAHARGLVERFRVPEERVLATRGAVDASAFTPDGPDLRAELGIAAGAPVAGMISRIKPGRRHEDLVDAFRAVADRIPEARLVIVGRGEGEEGIRARVAQRGLEKNVIFAGFRTGGGLAAAYRTLDAKVLLAEGNDGTCRALLEGMAAGRPGVAYRFGAPAEAVVDGATGLLVPEGDVGALSDALVELLGAIPRARALGRAARARMESAFTEAARGEAIAAFLERIRSLPPAGRAA
jgi:L-malate glycosyltransferase